MVELTFRFMSGDETSHRCDKENAVRIINEWLLGVNLISLTDYRIVSSTDFKGRKWIKHITISEL